MSTRVSPSFPARFAIQLDWPRVGLIIIVLATLLNGLWASIQDQFVPQIDTSTESTQAKYLGVPCDLHADLIALALPLPPFTPINAASWPYPYRKFVLQNHYHSFDLSQGTPVDISSWSPPLAPQEGEYWETRNPLADFGPGIDKNPSSLELMPCTLLVSLSVKRLILAVGPIPAVILHYTLAFAGLFFVCAAFLPDGSRRIWAFVALALSFPFLDILLRGNQGALFTGIALIAFVYLVCRTDKYLLAAALLAFACNIRPNAVALAPLLLCFGWRNGIVGGISFGATAALIFGTCYKIDQLLYPGYQLSYFLQALKFYYNDYVLGVAGQIGNNSIYGAISTILYLDLPHSDSHLYHPLFDAINKDVTLCSALALLAVCALFLLGKLRKLDFAFLLVCIYVLGSAVLAAYHLIVFAAFILLLADSRIREFSPRDLVILFTSVFLLIPKHYFSYRGITPDVVLNPLVTIAAFAFICLGQSGWLPSGLSLRKHPTDYPVAGQPARDD